MTHTVEFSVHDASADPIPPIFAEAAARFEESDQIDLAP